MIDEGDFEAILADARVRTGALQQRHDANVKGGSFGCLLILAAIAAPLVGILLLAVVVTSDRGSAALRWLLGSATLACSFVVAFVLGRRGQKMEAPLVSAASDVGAALDETLVRPLVERLVPGSTFSRPLVASSGFHPSLLFEQVQGKALASHSRIEGTLAGLPVVLEEVPSSFDENIEGGWIARFVLPFAVNGHLRIRAPKRLAHTSRWNKGFEQLREATARLGARYTIDAAPAGSGPDHHSPVQSDGLHPDVLLTEALFERLRASPDIDVAAAGRDLWVSVPRAIRAFDAHATVPTSVEPWRKAARAIAEIDGIVTAILIPFGPAVP
jgi:hypothetical protein